MARQALPLPDSGPGDPGPGVLSPQRTPRSTFQLSRRLVGVSTWPLALLTATYAVSLSDQYLFSSVVPFLKHDFRLSDTQIGVLGSAFLITATLGTLPFGMLVDRVRRTRVIAWGALVWSFALLWNGLAGGFLTLLAARAALGIAQPAAGPASQSLLADYYPVNQRSKVMSVYQVGQLTAFFLIPVGALMAVSWGWRSAFYFFALPGFVVAALVWRLKEPVRGAQDRLHGNRAVADVGPSSAYQAVAQRVAYREILRGRTYLVALVSTAIGGFFFGGIGVWTVTFLTRYHRLTVPQASAAVSLFALGGLIGALGSGYAADRLANAGYPAARVIVAGGSRLLCAPLMFVAFAVPNVVVMLLAFTLGAALIIAPLPPLNAALADVLHPNLRGRGVALYSVVKSLCEGTSPILFGLLADRIGLRTAFLVLIPLVAVAGLLLLAFGTANYGRDRARVLDALSSSAARPPGDVGQNPDGGGLGPSDGNGPVPSDVGPRPAPTDPADSETDALLMLSSIDFSYGQIRVLFDLDLRLPVGGCHVLLGRNGVGKTTLLSCIAGLLDPQGGRMWFRGEELGGVPPDQRSRMGISLVVGGKATFPGLSLRDNLWMGAYSFTKQRRLVNDRLDAVLDVFPALRERLGQAAGTLSGGEQQMMALGRALMSGPELLLIDELSMGLAPLVVEEIVPVLGDIVRLGTTLLVVEQSVQVALRIADNVLYMDRVGIRALGPPNPESAASIAALMMGARA
jgi:ABC-type branched-subunit amino acid transport system ATPase component/MFS family permease